MPRQTPAPRPADPVALARIARRLARADTAPWLHAEVARRMAERLPLVKLQPARIVDWDARSGGAAAALRHAYPRARVVAVEPSGAPPAAAAGREDWRFWRRKTAAAALSAGELPAGQAELLWSNMSLHRAVDPAAVMRAWHAAVGVGGFLMFSTLGPGSLQALRALYATRGLGAPFAPFVDMHDLGDMLLGAGWADPVMDQETLTLTWPDGRAALAELRGLGGNADAGRFAGLRTPRWRDGLAQALERDCAGADGRVALGFEVVYGHAFRAAPRGDPGRTEVPLETLREMARARRRDPPG